MMRLDGHVAVVDLGHGDAGKGTVVDAICAATTVAGVIRFDGGAAATHHVVTADGRHHAFAQFGAGTLQGVPTHLSGFTAVDPLALAAEAGRLAGLGVPDPFGLLTVDGEAPLTTPWHRAAGLLRGGLLREGRDDGGVDETIRYADSHADAPRAADGADPLLLRRRLAAVRARLTEEHGPLGGPPLDHVADAFRAFADAVDVVDGVRFRRWLLGSGVCVFEGAHGVLRDARLGWHPEPARCTPVFAPAEALCGGADLLRLGVLRAYAVRRGAGPMVTEDAALDLPEPHGASRRWWGGPRVGHFDAVAHRCAVEVAGGVDGLAVTHLDAPGRAPGLRLCTSYAVDGGLRERLDPAPAGDRAARERLTALLTRARQGVSSRPDDFSAAIGAALGVAVLVESRGPRSTDKVLTRAGRGLLRMQPDGNRGAPSRHSAAPSLV